VVDEHDKSLLFPIENTFNNSEAILFIVKEHLVYGDSNTVGELQPIFI
jgi:hypothetical protein